MRARVRVHAVCVSERERAREGERQRQRQKENSGRERGKGPCSCEQLATGKTSIMDRLMSLREDLRFRIATNVRGCPVFIGGCVRVYKPMAAPCLGVCLGV